MSHVAQRVQPFEFAFTTPQVHDREYLFLTATQGHEQVQRLHTLLYQALAVPAPQVFVPHLTIGRRDDAAAIARAHDRAAAQRLRVDGVARELTVYRVEPDGQRIREATIPLGCLAPAR